MCSDTANGRANHTTGGLSAEEASAALDAAMESADPAVILGMLDSLNSVPVVAWIPT